jgi:DNA gyrase/topoisomerase IV subunit A
LISQDQIEEWIREVEERPASGALIVRFISNRLRDLTLRNEDLLAENIALRSNKRVEEYESRIASLEYQLEMLRRQVGGDLNGLTDLRATADQVETISVIIYLPIGRVLRVETRANELESGGRLAQLLSPVASNERPPRLLVTRSKEELVFLFDTGRTVTMPVAAIPAVAGDGLAWKDAYLVEPRAGEELATVAPLARLALADAIVQVSRRGCLKRMMRNSFESHLGKNYIGAGIVAKPDLNCGLVLAGKDDTVVISSREGAVLSAPVGRLPYTSEESLRLSVTDYIVSAFAVGRKTGLLFVTNTGKAVVRETGWLEAAASSKSRGQALLSTARREAGTRLSGAAAVDENDWGAALLRSGTIRAFRAAELAAFGALPDLGTDDEVIDFCTFAVKAAAGEAA